MATLSLSLPNEQINVIDGLARAYGFANRSEFVRSLIRLITKKPDLVERAAFYPFVPPKEKSAKKILSDFKKTKKYSRGFLIDLEEGLGSSDYFIK